MGGVAGVAGDAVIGMGGVPELRLIAAGLMTLLAALGIFRRVSAEREDQLVGCGGFGVVPCAASCASACALPGPWQVSQSIAGPLWEAAMPAWRVFVN